MKIFSVLLIAIAALVQPYAQSATQQALAAPLSIGIFADADSLPLIVAANEGLFQREGVAINLVRFSSAVERDSALQAGKIDGAVTDVLAVVLANQGGFPLKITSLTNGRYGVAVSPKSNIQSMKELEGKNVAVSLNTIIHYFADWSVTQAGLGAGALNLVPVPKMPVRLEMLLSDQIAAAVMPEPFLTTAKLRGAKILVSSDDSGLEAGVLAFPPAVIAKNAGAIQRFYRAYWEAAQRINARPDQYRSMLVDSLSFPEEAARVFLFPKYVAPRLPSQASIDNAVQWLLSKGLIKASPKHADLVDASMVNGW
ncbi:MAG: MetQ/NlpA family ABC transporter substrate-binding protein [Rectinema sp.]